VAKVVIGVEVLHFFIFDMGVIDLLARVERLINDGPGAHVFEFDLDTGLLRGALVMVIDTAEELSIDYDRNTGFYIINSYCHEGEL
jgi:hypothetical protein